MSIGRGRRTDGKTGICRAGPAVADRYQKLGSELCKAISNGRNESTRLIA